jgi:uncharacterized protein YdeI (YjbR/CyaY-like superfamily)
VSIASHFGEAICFPSEVTAETSGSMMDGERLTTKLGQTLRARTRQQFRAWLRDNHAKKKEIWLIQYKKATGKPGIDYVDAVEEAICFGWIDSFERSLDADRYATRFTPRRPRSNWTETNKERARRMIAAHKMTAAGRKTLPEGI